MSDPLPPVPAPETRGASLPRLRRRLAALSVVGALMVALPLVQVLRYQAAEIHALIGDRAGLDPVARAVELERGLLAHREVAGLVLRGRVALEHERQLRQATVDTGVTTLGAALAGGPWERATAEGEALRDDWAMLEREVGARSIGAAESDQAHRLLVEQTLQVIDLVSDALPAHAELGEGAAAPTLALLQTLPRLTWQLAAPLWAADELESPVGPAELAAVESGFARTLGAVRAASDLQRSPPADDAPRQALADAATAAGAAADRALRQLRLPAGAAAQARSELAAAATAAVQAQFRLLEIAHESLQWALDRRRGEIERARALALAALAALAGAAAALLALLLRQIREFEAATQARPADAAMKLPSAPRRDEAGRLLQRLRAGDDSRTRPRAAEASGEPQPTLPPDL